MQFCVNAQRSLLRFSDAVAHSDAVRRVAALSSAGGATATATAFGRRQASMSTVFSHNTVARLPHVHVL